MKKGAAKRGVTALLLSFILVCTFVIDAQSMSWTAESSSIPKDLNLVSQLEPEDTYAALSSYWEELYSLYGKEVEAAAFLEARRNASVYGKVNFRAFTDIYDWEKKNLKELSPLYKSQYYKSYYNLRTERFLKQYNDTGKFDMKGFLSASKDDFAVFVKANIKGSVDSDRLILLLQDKLLDRLLYESLSSIGGDSRDKSFVGILDLRGTDARSRANEYIYQLFENRVRLELIEQLVQSMQKSIKKESAGVGIGIVSWNEGALCIGGRTVELLPQAEVFCCYITLGEILNAGEFDIKYIRANDAAAFISRERLLEKLSGTVDTPTVAIDEILNKPSKEESSSLAGEAGGNLASADREMLLQNEYIQKAVKAQAITKELNRLEIYLSLKNKGISNNVTKAFEKNKAAWLKNMRGALNAFSTKQGSDGTADFMLYIKQFVNYDRVCRDQNIPTQMITLRFRDTVLRLRPMEEGELWLLDMLYKMKSLK